VRKCNLHCNYKSFTSFMTICAPLPTSPNNVEGQSSVSTRTSTLYRGEGRRGKSIFQIDANGTRFEQSVPRLMARVVGASRFGNWPCGPSAALVLSPNNNIHVLLTVLNRTSCFSWENLHQDFSLVSIFFIFVKFLFFYQVVILLGEIRFL